MCAPGTNNASKSGLWGGTVSSLELKLNITQDMDGHVYTCQSTNEMLQRSINVAVNLPVLYEPKFSPPAATTVNGVEGEPLTVALLASGNPTSIAYTWIKDGQRIVSSGSLNLGKPPQSIEYRSHASFGSYEILLQKFGTRNPILANQLQQQT
uniref:Ig-like domain-containing protein n=1 Tax=Anopheles farauti TaxID=69004 RepID=A0A182Q0N1_9DIPT